MKEVTFRVTNPKYRIFDNVTKSMGESFTFQDAAYEGFPRPVTDDNGECNKVMDYYVLVYTGLMDKNGVEICQGDVFGEYSFTGDFANQHEPFGFVYFDHDLAAWCVNCTNGGWKYLHEVYEKPRVSVIGNIYEQPELLK